MGDPLTDVAKAIKAKWDASATITANIPGGLHEGPLDAPQDNRPYASLEVKQGPRPNEYGSEGDWLDYEEVTITVYGIGFREVGNAVGAAKGQLEVSGGALTIPNAVFLRLEVLAGWSNVKDDKKAGQDYRKAIMRYCVWSYRTP